MDPIMDDPGDSGAPARAGPASVLAAAGARLRRGAGLLLDNLLPPRCLACGALVDRQGALCAPCWAAISFIDAPFCARCGLPFEVDAGEEAECGACLRSPPTFRRARAALRYDEGSRRLILGLKHGDRTHAARPMAGWMARAGAQMLAEADLIAPVPLHWTRLVRRRFNQSALLAGELARGADADFVPELLTRRRRTPSQAGFTARQRALNVRGAFAVPVKRRARLEGRAVLLIDDVMTTGATIEACARTLTRAGAARVDVLVLARVVRASQLHD